MNCCSLLFVDVDHFIVCYLLSLLVVGLDYCEQLCRERKYEITKYDLKKRMWCVHLICMMRCGDDKEITSHRSYDGTMTKMRSFGFVIHPRITYANVGTKNVMTVLIDNENEAEIPVSFSQINPVPAIYIGTGRTMIMLTNKIYRARKKGLFNCSLILRVFTKKHLLFKGG